MKCIAISLLSTAFATASVASTSVSCSSPPGGSITCPDQYAAICKVTNGQVHGQCIDPPESYDQSGKLDFLRRVGVNVSGRPNQEAMREFDNGSYRFGYDSYIRFKVPAASERRRQ